MVATMGQHPGLHASTATDIEHTLRRCDWKVFHQRSVHKLVAYSAAECAAAAGVPVGKWLTVVGGRGPGVHHMLFEVRGAYGGEVCRSWESGHSDSVSPAVDGPLR
ncbi:hypothetical protein GCM10010449_05630 [Streptomyces rectiviolaceus]|uniref:Uncharacterized protein n=1 Tax=Streptomyces rectiviolaceus TaxID=332591 RepID=A0ABP6M6Z2_9ACTN